MTAQLIDGKAIAEAVRREAAVESARLKSLTGQVTHPGSGAGG